MYFSNPNKIFNKILFLFLFLSLIESRYGFFMQFIFALRFLIATLGFLQFIYRNYNSTLDKNSHILIYFLVFALINLLAGAINHNLRVGIIFTIYYWTGILLFIYCYKEHIREVLHLCNVMFIIIAVMSLAYMVFDVRSMLVTSYTGETVLSSFYGGKNSTGFYVIPAIIVNLIQYRYFKNGRRSAHVIIQIIYAVELFASGSSTAKLAGVILYFLYFTTLFRFLNKKVLIVSFAILFTSFVLLRVQDHFNDFLVTVLHRNATLSYRTNIWDIALEYIRHKPLIGYGAGNSIIHDNLTIQYIGNIQEVHNGILEILLNVGLMGLLSFLAIMYKVLKSLDYHIAEKAELQMIRLYIFTFLVTSIGESSFALGKIIFWAIMMFGICLASETLSKTVTDVNLIDVRPVRELKN